MIADELLRKYPIVSGQMTRERLHVVLRSLEEVLQANVPGDIVEFGCYIGTTALFLRRMLDVYHQSDKRELHVYDSFAGLPEKSKRDSSPAGEQFRAGELAASKKRLLHEFQKAGLQPPAVHKGWFGELTLADVPPHIAFGFLDGDFYDSIRDSLRLVWPRMCGKGIIAVDDFGREALPGAERAVRDFLERQQFRSLRTEHHIGIIEL